MLNSVISKHFKYNDHKYDTKKNTMYLTKRRHSQTNSFDLQPSRDQQFGYFNRQLNYCAVDYYDISKHRVTTRGFSTPVRKLKQSSQRANSYRIQADIKQSCQIVKFEGQISRDSPFRNWVGFIEKPRINKQFQLEKIANYVRNIEKNRKCESQQLQEFLNGVNNRIEWNSLPKVLDFDRLQTPDLLKDARVKLKRY